MTRQVLVPGTTKAVPHLWLTRLLVSQGAIPNEKAAITAEDNRQSTSVQRKIERQIPRIRRYGSGGTSVRNPDRVERLRKNGRLRRELR